MTNRYSGKPELVAHRGYANSYPENSLSAFSAAINYGAKYLELDVQLTSDHVPCVVHDDTLLRTGGVDVSVLESQWSELEGMTIGEEEKFRGKFSAERLTSLKDFVTFLQKNEKVHAFVEIKEESVNSFGNTIVLNAVLEELGPVSSQVSIISFDADVLAEAKKIGNLPIGFVVHGYDDQHHRQAQELLPNIIICNYKKIPDEDNALWSGDWQWMLYEVTDPEIAFKWYARGVKYIETMDFANMMTALKEN